MKQKRAPRNLLGFVRPERSDRRAFAIGFLAVVGLIGSVAAAAAIDMSASPPTSGRAVRPAIVGAVSADAGWSTLSVFQKSALAPLHAHWAALDAATQARWIHVSDRLQGMPPSAVARAQARMAGWQHLSHERREGARQRFELATRLSAEERTKRWQQYEASLEARAAAGARTAVRAPSAPLPPTAAVLRPAAASEEHARPAVQAVKPQPSVPSTGLPS